MSWFPLRSSSLSCWSSLSLESPLSSWPWTSVSASRCSSCSYSAVWSSKSRWTSPLSHRLPGCLLCHFLPPFLLTSWTCSLRRIYCSRIVNSSELMKIPLLHIKFPIPYNRLFPMPNFIKPIAPPYWLFAEENVKKGWDTARAKEWNMRSDDLCFLHFIGSLAVCG